MGISSIGATGYSADVNSDVRVVQLRHQIADWSTCPTTPAPTKRVIVNKLQTQLDGVIQDLQKQSSTRRQGSIDIYA